MVKVFSLKKIIQLQAHQTSETEQQIKQWKKWQIRSKVGFIKDMMLRAMEETLTFTATMLAVQIEWLLLMVNSIDPNFHLLTMKAQIYRMVGYLVMVTLVQARCLGMISSKWWANSRRTSSIKTKQFRIKDHTVHIMDTQSHSYKILTSKLMLSQLHILWARMIFQTKATAIRRVMLQMQQITNIISIW